MESRKLSALLSSLISQLLLLLFLLFDADSDSDSDSNLGNRFPLLIRHFLSAQESAAAVSLLSLSASRRRGKRKRDRLFSNGDESEGFHGGFGPRTNPDAFRGWFRMRASTFEWLAGSLEPLLDCRDPVGAPLGLSAERRLAIGLFRLSTGAGYAEIARRFGVAEDAARFCAKQLCRVLCTDFRFWVNLLSPGELGPVSAGFEKRYGLPNCCGVIGCARFAVGGAKGEDRVAAQIVVDSSSRVLSIVAGFRGSGKTDRGVLKLSTLSRDIEEKRLLNSGPIQVNGVAVDQYFVGIGRYNLLPWLMVRLPEAVSGSSEECFNEALDQMRIPMATAVVSLRNWGVLSRPMEEEVKTGVAYIGACSILHNALLMREDYSALADESEAYSLPDQSSEYSNDDGFNGDSIDEKASVVRNALATKAKEFRNSKHRVQS